VSNYAQVKKLFQHIILHLYQPTLANTAVPCLDFGVENDFTSFENWFRCMHNVRMVQLVIEGTLKGASRL